MDALTIAPTSVRPAGFGLRGAASANQLAALQSVGRRADANDPRAQQDAAAKLVSQVFFAPLLAEMRKLPFGRDVGFGGRMEEAFGEQLDLRVADVAAATSARPLVDGIARKLARPVPSQSRPEPAASRELETA